MTIKTESLIWLVMSIVTPVLMVALILGTSWSSEEKFAMSLSSIMGVIAIFGFGWYARKRLQERNLGVPSTDERTVGLEGRIFKRSFLSSFWIVIILAWVNIILRYLGRDQFPADISLVLVLSAMFVIWALSSHIFLRSPKDWSDTNGREAKK